MIINRINFFSSRNFTNRNLLLSLFNHQRFSTSQSFLFQNDVNKFLVDFPSVYSQKDCEHFWSNVWERSKLFKDQDKNDADSFRILLPPPNITGSLHLGHSLTVAIQDSICRFQRMNGKNVTFYGGTDHAGIATQMVIEKILWAKERKTRYDVSQERFAEIFEQWKCERISEIQSQLKSLGAGIDFESDYFTLSPKMSEVVNEAFINLFNQNLIYRQSYMVNWSYYLQSTLSDIEIEHRHIHKPTMYQVPGCDDKFMLGVLHYFKYPIETADSQQFVTIATTRLESLMGDVALCVNPNDSRYSDLIGKTVFNPFTNQSMPIIADECVKPEFGTGVLKLTPAHSAVDFEIAQRHKLPLINIFDDRGYIQCSDNQFNNIHRYAAKEVVKNELEKRGLYCGYKEHSHSLPVCSRSGDIIESKIVPQWFLRSDSARFITEFLVNTDNLSEVSEERWQKLKQNLDPNNRNISLIPSSYRNTWKDWFSRYKDWCISRQIYYGHRIPAYQVYQDSKPTEIWIAAKSKENAMQIAKEKHSFDEGNIELRQDTDVLDTWFSSGLLPLTVSGWFDGKRFHDNMPPLSLMETGHDIIFFWVARMVLLSLLSSNQTVIPFNKVLLHGMICDANGKKMSKSKGNVVDPMHLINGASLEELVKQNRKYLDSGIISDEMFNKILRGTMKQWPNGLPICGGDILRLSLVQSDFKEHRINFDLGKTVKKRVFANKMHQTVRFILLNLDDNFQMIQLLPEQLSNIDRWILSRLTEVINLCRFSFESYDIQYAAREVEKFWINDLCDIYLENMKYDIQDTKNDSYIVSMNVLLKVVRNSLRAIHPFMPFITENLYQHIEYRLAEYTGNQYRYKSILETKYPDCKRDNLLKHFDHSYMDDFEKVMAIVRKIRWFKQNFFIHRDPLIENVRIASLYNNLVDYHKLIESSLKIENCQIEFVNLNDIYKYDDCYCIKVELEDDSKQKEDKNDDNDDCDGIKSKSNSNSLNSDEIYLLFKVDSEKLRTKLNGSKLKLKKEKVDSLMNEIEQLQSKRFTENYKRTTKIIS